jgi:hypothetical protein
VSDIVIFRLLIAKETDQGMKTTEVAESIALLLRENEVVMIPGLGGFRATYSPATVDQVLGDLHPPGLRVEFDENLAANDGLLVGYISNVQRVPIDSATQTIRNFVSQASEILEKRGMVTFPEIGRLRLDIEGNLQFLPEGTNISPDTFGLPPLRFRPLQPTVPGVDQATTPAPTAAPARRFRLLFATLALSVFVAGMVYVLLRPGIKPLFPARQVELPEARVNVAPSDPGVFPEAEASRETAETASVGSRQCIIAIGLFKDPDNVERLKDRIKGAGFQPFVEEMPEFTRVGVAFQFQEESEIAGMLSAVRTRVSADAFVWKK